MQDTILTVARQEGKFNFQTPYNIVLLLSNQQPKKQKKNYISSPTQSDFFFALSTLLKHPEGNLKFLKVRENLRPS